MARVYKKRRFYRKKGRWSANIKTLTTSSITAAPGTFFGKQLLCENPPQSDNSVSQQYTVKNVEVSYELESLGDNRNLEGLTVYIIYVPQGMIVSETYPNFHPEYIMAMRFLGSPNEAGDQNNPGRNPLRIKTRLARRLQTGDSVQLLVVGSNPSQQSDTLYFNGVIRWWTKAN